MTAIHLGQDKTNPNFVAPKKSGEYYDDCASCGKRDLEPTHKFGDRRGEHLNWSMYNCDPRTGGCNDNWTRTTRQGVERNLARNRSTRWLTASAAAERMTSMPSEEFRTRYALIDWSK